MDKTRDGDEVGGVAACDGNMIGMVWRRELALRDCDMGWEMKIW